MRKKNYKVGLGLFVALGVLVGAGTVFAQGGLRIGGSSANFGTHSLSAGFMPDPQTINVTSGATASSAINIANAVSGCRGVARGYATANPDAILNYSGSSPTGLLRFYFVANTRGQDTTLAINDASASWHCDDDTGGNLNPMVDIRNPPAGQYDIWVGSYRAGTNIPGRLYVTEMASNRP